MTRLALLIFFLLFSSFHAREGEEAKEVSQVKADEAYDIFLTIVIENDFIGSGIDQNYTNGIRFTYFNVNATFPEIAHTILDSG